MNEGLSNNSISSSQIYNGGSLNPISAEDLKGNIVAIKQLINNFNDNTKKLESVEKELQETKGDLEYQNTYPFIATFAAIFNVFGTILVGVGVNRITVIQDGESTIASTIILVIGGMIVILSSLSTILYKWGRKWFNKRSKVQDGIV